MPPEEEQGNTTRSLIDDVLWLVNRLTDDNATAARHEAVPKGNHRKPSLFLLNREDVAGLTEYIDLLEQMGRLYRT